MHNLLNFSPVVIGAVLLLATDVFALEPTLNESFTTESESEAMEQINSVFQLSDVKPTDWAFEALQYLVETYGCLAGYPDSTYRGNRALSRYEYAAGLNACLDSINRLLATGNEDVANQDDLPLIKRLQQEFATELAIIRARVDGLQARVTELDLIQFSPTTKLQGEVIFNLAAPNQPEFAGNRRREDSKTSNRQQAAFGWRANLNFDTSFTGKDRLRTRLRAGNLVTPLSDQTNMGGLNYQFDSDNNLELTQLQYRFGVGDATQVWISAIATELDPLFLETFNPYWQKNSGGFTQFAMRNPIYFQPNGAGVSIVHQFSDRITVEATYQASTTDNQAAQPLAGKGLFNGSFATGINTRYSVTNNWDLGLTYIYAYQSENRVQLLGNTGSDRSFDPFDGNATKSHNLGLQTDVLLANRYGISGWFGWTRALDIKEDNQGDIFNWAVTFTILDLFGEGNQGGLLVGMPPKLTDLDRGSTDPDTSLQIEGFYSHQLSENITITPGFYVLTNPEHDSDNDIIFVGILRTVFGF